MTQDEIDWVKLSEAEQHFIKFILSFFVGSDGIVNENLALRFYNDVMIPEARLFYGFQIHIEGVHSETYSLLIEKFVTDEKELAHLLHGIENIPCVKRKADWALEKIESNDSFIERLVAFACVEGIFFSASFCALFYFKKRGLMPGLTFSNELISADENSHTDFAVLLYFELIAKLSQEKIHAIISSAVEIEISFVKDALNVAIIGMKWQDMVQYVQFVADRLATQFGCEKIYKVSNPFTFMERMSLAGKTNFFERKVAEYRRFDNHKRQKHEGEFSSTSAF